VGGAVEFARHLRRAARMVGVLVSDQDGVHALGARAAQRFEAPQHFLLAKAGVDEEGGAPGFEQRRVARAAGGQNGDAKRDAVALSRKIRTAQDIGRARRLRQRKNIATPFATSLRAGRQRHREPWESLVDGVGVDADVLLAGGLLFVVLLYPRGEAFPG